jgi:hypothetical protein
LDFASRLRKKNVTPTLSQLCPCNTRNAGKPDAAASFRGSSDTFPAQAWSKNHALASCLSFALNAVVLG